MRCGCETFEAIFGGGLGLPDGEAFVLAEAIVVSGLAYAIGIRGAGRGRSRGAWQVTVVISSLSLGLSLVALAVGLIAGRWLAASGPPSNVIAALVVLAGGLAIGSGLAYLSLVHATLIREKLLRSAWGALLRIGIVGLLVWVVCCAFHRYMF
jgi:hypothetical protein